MVFVVCNLVQLVYVLKPKITHLEEKNTVRDTKIIQIEGVLVV